MFLVEDGLKGIELCTATYLYKLLVVAATDCMHKMKSIDFWKETASL